MSLSNSYHVEFGDMQRDKDKIFSLWQNNGLATRAMPDSLYSWAFKKNPFGEGLLLVLKHSPSNDIVGTIGLILKQMKVCGSTILSGRVAFFAVDSNHRSLGPAIMLQKSIINEAKKLDVCLLYTMTPPDLVKIIGRLKYKSIGELDVTRRLVSPSKLIDKYIPFKPFNRILIYTANLGFNLISIKKAARRGNMRYKRVYKINSHFDKLWEHSLCHNPFTTERSSSFLNWRFSDNPIFKKEYFCYTLTKSKETVIGYVIYYLQDNWAIIVDLFTDGQDETLDYLISEFTAQLRERGLSSVLLYSFGCNELLKKIKKCGYGNLKSPESMPYSLMVYAYDEQLLDLILDMDSWSFLIADDINNFD